jgi:hypothetical protein
VRRDDGIGVALGVAAIARPRVFSRSERHVRPHWIKLDVALACEELAIGRDDGRTQSPLEKRSAAAVRAVDVLHMALAESFHEQ